MSELPKIEVWTGEEHLLAMLLRVVDEACSKGDGKLDSWERWAYASALRELGSCGLVEIERECDRDVVAKMTPKGEAFLKRLEEKERKEAVGCASGSPSE